MEDRSFHGSIAWIAAAGAAVIVAVVLLWGSGPTAPPATAAAGPPGDPSAAPAYRPDEQDRGVAFGLLLDSPVEPQVLDAAIALAESLRVRYGIDTGNLQADRQQAAERAMREVVDPLRFGPEELQGKAQELGYSLDPAECANYCDNVRRLAEVELRKEALRRFAGTGSTVD